MGEREGGEGRKLISYVAPFCDLIQVDEMFKFEGFVRRSVVSAIATKQNTS